MPGLILEGGSFRTAFTLGVIDVLIKNEIYFPYIIGVSAGACAASSYMSKQYYRGIDIFLKYRNSEFVKAAKVKGASDLRIMILHIFPNLLQELSVTATLSFSGAIMSEAGLSYLSLGIQPPTPSFGKMLSEAQNTILTAGWYVVIPAALITMLVLGFNLISDGLNEIYRH